ncbi:MAG TPA: TetR/AcrR family transcriptional regulator [Spirochaetales bacterium]|nr:TetR/AcrR family transcriptional regulator [Spirochaetales bacterium]
MAEGMTKRQEKARGTKQAIFEAALRLFREKGFDAVTVEDIAREAGTAKGSFYTYFRTKSDIIIEEFRAIDGFYRDWSKNLKRYAGAREKLLAFARAQFRYVRDKVGVATLKQLYANNILQPDVEKVLIDTDRFLHRMVRAIMEEGQAALEFRADIAADRLALLYDRSFRAVFLDWAISSDGFDLVKEGVEWCETMVLPAIEVRTARQARPSG